MLRLVLRRLLLMIPMLFIVSVIVFGMVYLTPGDPAHVIAGRNATEEQVAATRHRLGLDVPVQVQYGRWALHAVQGDFGESLYSGQSVTDAIEQRFPATISVAIGATIVALLVGIPLGILAAVFRGRFVDRFLTMGATAGIAIPSYFVGMLLVLTFAIWNRVLPATGYVAFTDSPAEWFKGLILPWVALGLGAAAVVTRQLRSSMIGVLGQDYVRTARAKGLRSRRVVVKHALKNAAIPVVTVVGAQVSIVLGGTVIVEKVFGITAIGSLLIEAVLGRDVPVIQGIVVMFTLIVMFVNLLVDVSYGYFNPRVRVT